MKRIVRTGLFGLLSLALFFAAHAIGITYGTEDIALHQSYVGDEQSPINAALHAFKDKSLLAFRNEPNLYYGPMFAVIAIPAVGADALYRFAIGAVLSAEGYRDLILRDWGGIVIAARILATIAGFSAVVLMYMLARRFGAGNTWAIGAATLLALNYFFFEYAHFFKHWVFVIMALMGTWYCAYMIDREENRYRYWFFAWCFVTLSFGISYISGIYNILWAPMLIVWLFRKDWARVREAVAFSVVSLLSFAALVAWHPYAFTRLWEGNAFIPLVGAEVLPSWWYYLHLVLVNHVGIIIALGISFIALVYAKRDIIRDPYLWAIVLPGVLNYIVFSMPSRAEGRYMLPTIMSILVAYTYVLARHHDAPSYRGKRLVAVACITAGIVTFVYHSAAIIEWNRVYARGHHEQHMIRQVLAWQAADPDTKTLLIQDYLAGYAHRRDAYERYIQATHREQVPLYQSLRATPLPDTIDGLNVDYYIPQEFRENKDALRLFYMQPVTSALGKEARAYDRVVYEYKPRLEPNQFDYTDFDIARIWWYSDLNDQYFYFK